MKASVLTGLACALLSLPIAEVDAHKLSPTGTAEERQLSSIRGSWLSNLGRWATYWGVVTFGDPVHEEITNRIYGCDGLICGDIDSSRAPGAVLAGVRWNDDPPFRISATQGRGTTCKTVQTIRFQTQPYCWYQLFSDAEKNAAKGAVFGATKKSAMLYRTHFGDLQFLHAMGSRNGEAATETQRSILGWAEFNWRIMLGELGLESQLKAIDNETVRTHFGYSDWYVQDLYTLGAPNLRSKISDVAFGSILHTLEDSFAEGHVERSAALPSQRCGVGAQSMPAPGEIVEFHSYTQQDHDLHAAADSRGALEEHLQDTPDVVEIGRFLLGAYEQRRSWDEVRPFFECIYRLNEAARPATAGEAFESTHQPSRQSHPAAWMGG